MTLATPLALFLVLGVVAFALLGAYYVWVDRAPLCRCGARAEIIDTDKTTWCTTCYIARDAAISAHPCRPRLRLIRGCPDTEARAVPQASAVQEVRGLE